MEKKELENKPRVFLTKEQELELYKSLAYKTFKQAGYDMGLHLMFPDNDKGLVSFVNEKVKKIRRAPELWGLSQEALEVIEESISSRSVRNNPRVRSDIAIQEESFRDKLDTMRDTVAEIITKKLDKYKTSKGMDGVSIRDLKDLLAMTIDKSRLLKGESTENIKRLSPIDVDSMSPEDALKVISKARDALNS